jgi:hypothetical protein
MPQTVLTFTTFRLRRTAAYLMACAVVCHALLAGCLVSSAHADDGGPALANVSAVESPSAIEPADVSDANRDCRADDEVTADALTSFAGGSLIRFIGFSYSAANPSALDGTESLPPVEAIEPGGDASLADGALAADSTLDNAASEDADLAGLVASEQHGHELWVVSTRGLRGAGCGQCVADFNPTVEQFVCGRGWIKSSLAEFMATDDNARTTAIFVHGNDTDASEAESRGRSLYRSLLTSRCDMPSTRLVIWSWPSERVIPRYRKDAQLKACRTTIEGYYLAQFIDQLGPQTPVSLGGYSYGAGVVTSGLHYLGGGTLDGRQLVERQHPDRDPANVILLGAAIANNWLLPGMRHQHALSQVERMVILFNPTDFVLHFYPRLWGGQGPEALGATGLAAPRRLGTERAKITQINVQPQLHRRHGWDYFRGSGAIMSLVRRELIHLPAVTAADDESMK